MDKAGSLEDILGVLESLAEKAGAILFQVEGLAGEIREVLDTKVDAAGLAELALEDERAQELPDTDAAGTAEQVREGGEHRTFDIAKEAAEAEARLRKQCGWDKQDKQAGEQQELDIW